MTGREVGEREGGWDRERSWNSERLKPNGAIYDTLPTRLTF